MAQQTVKSVKIPKLARQNGFSNTEAEETYMGMVEPKIEAFDPDGDQFKDLSSEQMLEKLEAPSPDEEIREKVVIDSITGEKQSSRLLDNESEEIESLNDITPESLDEQLSQMAVQAVTFLVGDKITTEEIMDIVDDLKVKTANMTQEIVNKMTREDVKAFIGPVLFESIKETNANPTTIGKQLIIDLKNAIVEKSNILDSVAEANKYIDMVRKHSIKELEEEAIKELESKTFPTDIHKNIHYLTLYTSMLLKKENYETEEFLQSEVKLSTAKILQMQHALSFNSILDTAKNLRTKISKDFKNIADINKLISNFLGYLNSNPNINVAFPIPKGFNSKNNIKETLTQIWLLHLEIAIVSLKFPVVRQLSSMEYFEAIEILKGNVNISDLTDESKERAIEISNLINDINIKMTDINEARKTAYIISYLLAKTFKESKLNDINTQYVLSHTMNLLSQAKKVGYSDELARLIMSINYELTLTK